MRGLHQDLGPNSMILLTVLKEPCPRTLSFGNQKIMNGILQ